ncbi:MAG: helix-turn-helix transcriptional regulator [Spirochaetia bacterium]|nr:helix-turn-helix transcriptional regulator [Spirochaetia bacterium]MBR0317900.1 helix-turn-helix transcriptional regulator [Spirochaetia bacterium]
MKPNSNLEKEVSIMQDHLQELRKLAGWSVDELSQKMGLTRQAVYALENGQAKMNQLHYLALIHLFSIECDYHKENKALAAVLNLLFNDTDNYIAKKEEYDQKIFGIASMGAVTTSTTAIVLGALLGPLGLIGASAVGLSSALSTKLLGLGKK